MARDTEGSLTRAGQDVIVRWLRGSVTFIQAQRELVILGLTPDEAERALADAKTRVS